MAGRGLRDSYARDAYAPMRAGSLAMEEEVDYGLQRQTQFTPGAAARGYHDRHAARRVPAVELEDEKDLYIRRQQRQIDDLRDELRMAREVWKKKKKKRKKIKQLRNKNNKGRSVGLKVLSSSSARRTRSC
jgi:hypothetical protein